MKSTGDRAVTLLPRRPHPEEGVASRAERGLTLVELLIGLAISGLIAAAALATIYGLLTFTKQANDTQLAVSQVRAAEHWMTRDVMSARTLTTGGDSGFPLTIEWTSADELNDITVTYSLTDMPSGSLKQMVREYLDTNGANRNTTVAQYVDPDQSSCAATSVGVLEVTLAATVRDQTETRTFEAKARPDSA